MKKLRSILSMILVVAAMLTYSVTALAASGFSDVSEGAYYAEAVTYASENGLISGTAPEQFSPDMTLSRGMLATMLWRNEGQPQVAPSTFSDVKSDSYYANAIGWAAENGIVSVMEKTDSGQMIRLSVSSLLPCFTAMPIIKAIA